MEVNVKQLIPILISEDQAIKFKIILDSGVFNLKNGKAVLNFDHLGNLRKIDIEQCIFKS